MYIYVCPEEPETDTDLLPSKQRQKEIGSRVLGEADPRTSQSGGRTFTTPSPPVTAVCPDLLDHRS